jgi:hypothetical protein
MIRDPQSGAPMLVIEGKVGMMIMKPVLELGTIGPIVALFIYVWSLRQLVLGFGLLINCSSVEETPFLLHPLFYFFSFLSFLLSFFADDGGGMDPDCMRQCMSLGFSAKSKSANTIGQCE